MKHKQTLRRGLSILLSLVMCLSLLPATALAEGTATPDQTADFTADGDATAALALLNATKTGTADSTWENNTLTLNGVNFSTTAETAVKLPAGAKIVLAEGTTNTIASTADNAEMSYGIYATNGLTIEGSGTLTVRSAKATKDPTSSNSYGIYAYAGDITITSGTVVTTGGEASSCSYGIRTDAGSITINDGTVIAKGGTADTISFGISANGGDITISGGAVAATGGISSTSGGISAQNNVTISGGTVTAKGGQAKAVSYGIYVYQGAATISGGGVTATGSTSGSDSCGIYSPNVKISGGIVTATGGAVTGEETESTGIYVYQGAATISGGHVIARTLATTATTKSALNVEPSLSGYTGYYWRTSSDGDFTNSTDTPYTFDGSHTYVEFDSGAAVTTSVEINAENFPDETFRKYVSDNFDTDTEKGVLSPAEIEAVTSIVCPNMGITDLKGIEHFTELTILSCSQNQLKELDVSKNTKLYGLNCSENQLKALDVSKNAELVVLTCSKNQLETLSVSGNAKLNSLNCSENQLKKINVSGNTALETLECSDNMLTALVVSNNTALKVLRCAKNQLTTLNVAKNSILNTLDCSGNQLTALSVSSNAELNSLDCSENQLETLDVSSNTSLDQLRCSNNRLKVLDVSKNTGLRLLYCKENQLTSLDLSENGKITKCYAENNSYEIELTSGRTFDLSTLPGKFEVGKASGWTDSSVSGNTLTVNDGATKVTYIYNCENSITAKFTLTVKSGSGVANKVAIDEANFPDEKFRQYVSVYTDKDGNGALSTDEIAQAEKIYCSNRGIKDFTGIEHFTALTELNCDKNQLIALDVSSNTALEYLECSESQLTTLNIGSNTKLKSLICSKNQLTSLDVSGNTALKDLVCSENRLATPNLSINPALENLDCSKNQLTGLDLSGNAALKNLDCSGNQLTTLGFSDGAVLEKLICSDNRLATLNVSGSAKLTELHCGQNKLASLDVSKNTALEKLDCSGNQLTTLVVSSNTALTGLDCSKNNLTSLNLTGTQVNILYADDNTYPIKLTSGRTFDLTDLPGKFEVEKVSGWNGGSVSGNILTVNADATEVAYTYDCGKNQTATFTLTVQGGSGQDEAVKIDETNFPDANFRAFVSDFDTNKDEKLSIAEIAVVTKIDCDDKGIANLKGIEHFTALQTLICSGNKLTSLDLKSNAALTFLNCNNNRLAELDVSKNTKLTDLFCDGNQLIVLDVSLNTALKNLFCQKNQLTSLDLANTSIGYLLYANDNSYEITPENGTFDLSTLPGKFDIGKASGWNGGTVDGKTLTVNPKVVRVTYQYDCGKASPVTFTLKVKGGGGQGEGIEINEANFPDSFFRRYVEKLDTNNDGALNKAEIAKVTEIDVYGNAVEDLTGIEHFTALEVLDCGGNMLTKLDVSKNTALTDLDCSGNQLADLDVSKNTELKSLACSGNELTVLDLSTNTELTNLSCYSNKLTSLDLSSTKVTDANELYADDNTYPIKLTSGRTFDLSSLPGKFEVGNAGGWNGGSVSGNILTVNADATEVTYTYDCGHNNTETFTLTVQGGGEHTHSYGSDWKNDADNHWHECSCGDRTNIEEHTASNWITDTAATATTDGTKHKECTVCGYVMETGTIPATGGSSSSSSSGGGSSSTPTYAPTVTQPENGTVTVSPKAPKNGDTVTITPKPEAGYTVEQILVTDKNGNPVKVTNNGDGTYSFTQPTGKVTVEVTFMEDNSMLNFFVDVPADAYYYDAVLWAAENGITGGVDDTHFAPNAPCTRAQIVTFLWRAAGSPEPETVSSFADVPADAYYAKAVAWAVENGITTGTGDGMFSPDATCTRAQAMAFIWRSQKSVAADGANPFTDVAADAYYADAVLWAVENGITNGTSGTTFSPNSDCTRAQIVTFLYRCLGEE